MSNEAKRHHYIPQFILRNFNDDQKQINYWDIANNKLEKRNTKSVFMNIDMYRDEINHEENPTKIESTLSIFEKEISELINNKFLYDKEIVINRAELEKLRIYLCLQMFRDDYRKQQYVDKKFDPRTLEILQKYVINDDYEDLWKREIEELAKCRKYQDVEKSEIIDPIVKMDFFNLLNGKYMTVIESRGGEFLMSDVYPTLEVFPVRPGINIHLHFMYPISPTRMILLNNIMFRPEAKNKLDFSSQIMVTNSKIGGSLITPPRNKYVCPGVRYDYNDLYYYKVEKVYQKDLEYMNELVLNEARIGVLFKNKEKVISSVHKYNNDIDAKKKYLELEGKLEGSDYDE